MNTNGQAKDMMQGLTMDFPLSLTHALERARKLFPGKEIITKTDSGTHRYTYAEFYERVCRLANALKDMGVKPTALTGIINIYKRNS